MRSNGREILEYGYLTILIHVPVAIMIDQRDVARDYCQEHLMRRITMANRNEGKSRQRACLRLWKERL